MRVIVKTDIKGWSSVVDGLVRISGKDYKDIIDAETSEILSQSSNRKSTKMADKTKVVSNLMPVGTFFLGYQGNKLGYTIKAGKAGVTKDTTYYLQNRLPFKVWDYIKTKTKKKTQEVFGNVGLAKGQFLHFHKSLGLPPPKKDFPKQAHNFLKLRRSRITNKVGQSKKGIKKEYLITFTSLLSKANSFGGSAKSLKSVMRARVRKFQTAIKKGTFREIKKRTRAYPLIFGR